MKHHTFSRPEVSPMHHKFVKMLQVRSLRAEVKGEKENSRGARGGGGGDPLKFVKNTRFTAIHPSAGLFRISYTIGYIIALYFFSAN